jgi:photosynthetic reaction center cytochrome c subunit
MAISKGLRCALLICAVFVDSATADPQRPQLATEVRSQDPEIPRGKPTNLKVLPADMPAVSLGRLMKRYERDLGVSCSYCHVENRDSGKLDYVSDENPKKHIARIMIAMVNDINDKHLEQLGADRRYAAAVTCGSCHQGRANPQPFEGRR